MPFSGSKQEAFLVKADLNPKLLNRFTETSRFLGKMLQQLDHLLSSSSQYPSFSGKTIWFKKQRHLWQTSNQRQPIGDFMLWNNRCVCLTNEKVTETALNERKIRNFIMKAVILFRVWVLARLSECTFWGSPQNTLLVVLTKFLYREAFGTWINPLHTAEITGRLVAGERRKHKGNLFARIDKGKTKAKREY